MTGSKMAAAKAINRFLIASDNYGRRLQVESHDDINVGYLR